MSEMGVSFDCVGVAVIVMAGVPVTFGDAVMMTVAVGVTVTLGMVEVLITLGIKVGDAVATTWVGVEVGALVAAGVATGLLAVGAMVATTTVPTAVDFGARVGVAGNMLVANGGAVGSDQSGTGVRLGVTSGRNAPLVATTVGTGNFVGVGAAKASAKAAGCITSSNPASIVSLDKMAFSKNSSAR